MLESLIINLLSSLLYDKFNIWKDKQAIKKFIGNLSEWAVDFEKRNDGTVVTKGLFFNYVKNYNIILMIIEYVLEPVDEKLDEKEFVNNTLDNFNSYFLENGSSLSIDDNDIIEMFITELLNKAKDFINDKVELSDKTLIYILVQTKNELKTILEKMHKDMGLTQQQIGLLQEDMEKIRSDFYGQLTLKLTKEWFDEQNDCAIKNLGNRYIPTVNIELEASKIFDGIARDEIFKKNFLKKSDEIIIKVNELKIESIKDITEELTNKIMSISFNSVDSIDYDGIHTLLNKLIEALQTCSVNEYKKLKERKGQNDYEYYRINNTLSYLDEFKEYLDSAEVCLTNKPFLLLEGEGGIGKSHLIADIVSHRKESGKKSLLLLGQQFSSSREPWMQIIDMLGVKCSVDDLLEHLNKLGFIQQSRVLIFIDAINEGGGKDLWKHYIAGIIEKIKRYSWIGLVLSVRTQYITTIFGDNNYLEETFISYVHTGFREVEYTAISKYFKFYKINQPVVPFMSSEFSNPLFLRLFCEGFENKTESIESINITKVFERYIKVINERLSERYGYFKSINFVRKVIERIVEYKFKENRMNNFMPIDDVVLIVVNLQREYGITGNIIEGLVSEGMLTQSINYKNEEFMYVTYERLEDYIYSSLLVDFIIQNDVKTFLSKYQDTIKNTGILESLAIQLPEKMDLEIYEVFSDKEDDLIIIEAFINSLRWRDTSSVKEKAIEYVNKNVFKREYTFELFWEVIISIATKDRHLFNAEKMYKHLNGIKMPDRDEIFIPLFNKMFQNRESSINRIIDWANLEEKKTYVSDTVIKLTVIVLAWFLSSSNRRLRDVSTKSIINILDGRFNVLMEFLRLFKEVDDPYIRERVYAIAFGYAVRETNQENLITLSQFAYKEVFNKDEVYPNILLRDYARNIIEYTLSKSITMDIDVSKIRPTYKSQFPSIPADKQIKLYKFDYNSPDFKDYYWSQNAILSSMKVEYSREGNPGGYGDFGRYTFQSYFSKWRDLHPMDLKNIAIKKIFDMGYDVEKHGEFDRSVKKYRGETTERIGKKYQWIALYELAAQVADNYEMSTPWSWRDDQEKMYCQGSFEPHIRNIDPTIVIKTVGNKEDNNKSIHNSLYNNFEKSNVEWLSTLEDMPQVTDLINIKHDRRYLLLNGHYGWKEDKKLGERPYQAPQKDFWVMIKSYIVKGGDFNRILNQIKDLSFMGRWMPEERDDNYTFNKEYYWSPAYKFFQNPYYGTLNWSNLRDCFGHEGLEGELLVTVQRYQSETDKDQSIEDGASWLKPCEEIYTGLGLNYGYGNSVLYDEHGEVACFDTSELWNEDIGLAIKKEQLFKFLDDNNYKIFWTVLTEKRILGDKLPENIKYKMPTSSGVYYYEGERLVGQIKQFDE